MTGLTEILATLAITAGITVSVTSNIEETSTDTTGLQLVAGIMKSVATTNYAASLLNINEVIPVKQCSDVMKLTRGEINLPDTYVFTENTEDKTTSGMLNCYVTDGHLSFPVKIAKTI